jgi:hypothetical protein
LINKTKMKKKHRSITIDGDDSWAWKVDSDYHYDTTTVKVWKDKVVKYEKKYSGDSGFPPSKRYSITPGLISRFIKRHLVK